MKKVRFYHRVGLDSRIFRTKHFEQKYVLTGFIIILLQWRLCPFNTKISFEISLYFVHFLRILHVYDFLSMFYLTEQLENAYIKSLDSMQKLNYISYFFSLKFQFDIVLLHVGSWLDILNKLLNSLLAQLSTELRETIKDIKDILIHLYLKFYSKHFPCFFQWFFER